MTILRSPAVLLLSLGFAAHAGAAEPTRVGESLLFEAEDWTTPHEAWVADRDTEDRWNLWSKNAVAGWSGGVVLRSPTVRVERATPEAGAPPLHTRLSGIPAGVYEVVLNRTGRPLAVSLDGDTWRRTYAHAEDPLGVFRIDDGTFELWIDDRYATHTGPGYYDYVRLDPFKPPTLSHWQAFLPPGDADNALSSSVLEICWTSDRPVPTGVVEIERGGVFEPEQADPAESFKLRNHRAAVLLSDDPRIRLRVRIAFAEGFEWTSPPVDLVVPADPPQTPPDPRTQVVLAPARAVHAERPVLAGVPFARGTVWHAEGLVAQDASGSLPTQNSVAARWPDGSVRWLFTRFLASAAQPERLQLASGESPPTPDMDCEGDGLFKNSRFRFSNRKLSCDWAGDDEAAAFALFDSVAVDASRITGQAELGNVRVIDGDGRAWGLGPAELFVWEETGPVRAVLRVEGHFQAGEEERRFAYRLRYSFAAGSPLVQVQLTLINDAQDAEFQRIRSLAMRIPVAGDEPLRGRLPGGAGMDGSDNAKTVDVSEPDKHEIWQLDSDRLRTIVDGRSSEQAQRSEGWAVVQRGDREIALAIRDFWQTWPKSIALKPDGLHVRLLPDMRDDKYVAKDLMDWMRHGYGFDADGCYLLRRGMALRHEFWVRFGAAGDIDSQGGPAKWAQAVLSEPYARAMPEQYCGSGVFGPVQTAGQDARPEYEAMIARNVELLLAQREKTGEYGWMNFGDWHGERTYNWGNNEYDLSWAMALHFARTGRWDYFAVGQDMARHYALVDTIHVPSSAGMPGRVWAHCVGHTGVGDRSPGGGPAGEALAQWLKADQWNLHFYQGMVDAGGHIYQEGNFAYYFLTGDRDLLESAELVCTAQATYMTPRFDFGIERGGGWPLSNAVAAYEATGHPFYLNAARIYVERVLAKHDRVGGGWLLPQPASECDGQASMGGKAFATGILLYGLMRYDLIEPRQDVKDCIVHACRWLVEQTWNDEKGGFRYKTGCDKYLDNADRGTSTALCLPGLVYGYQLSGDQRFLDVAQKGYATLCGFKDESGKAAAMVARQSVFALPGLKKGIIPFSP